MVVGAQVAAAGPAAMKDAAAARIIAARTMISAYRSRALNGALTI